MMLMKRAANRAGRPFGINFFPRAFGNPISERQNSATEVFDAIFSQNFWGSGESRSGVGSELQFTHRYRQRLAPVLSQFGIRRFFDAPCGDLNWIVALVDDAGLDYRGGDISPAVINEANARNPELSVRVFDITTDSFPEADVWHCRDCLFHLPDAAIYQALESFVHSSIPYALITSHRARFLHKNLDVGFGGFRFLDLERPPFGLPQPLARVADYRIGRDFPRYVCLWTREDIRRVSGLWR